MGPNLIRNKKTFFFFFLLLLAGVFVGLNVSALELQTSWPPSPAGTSINNTTNFSTLMRYIYEWLISLGGVAAFVMLVIGGVQYLSSAGNPGMMQEAMGRIKSAIFGLIFLLASWLILWTINPNLLDFKEPSFNPGGIGIATQNPYTTASFRCTHAVVFAWSGFTGDKLYNGPVGAFFIPVGACVNTNEDPIQNPLGYDPWSTYYYDGLDHPGSSLGVTRICQPLPGEDIKKKESWRPFSAACCQPFCNDVVGSYYPSGDPKCCESGYKGSGGDYIPCALGGGCPPGKPIVSICLKAGGGQYYLCGDPACNLSRCYDANKVTQPCTGTPDDLWPAAGCEYTQDLAPIFAAEPPLFSPLICTLRDSNNNIIKDFNGAGCYCEGKLELFNRHGCGFRQGSKITELPVNNKTFSIEDEIRAFRILSSDPY